MGSTATAAGTISAIDPKRNTASREKEEATISFLSGTTITLSENKVLFGGKRHEAIEKLLSLLRNVTFQTRMTNLVTKLLKTGQVELYKPILVLGSGEVVCLSKEGLVTTPSRSIDLKQAKASGTFSLGSEWRSLNLASYEVNPSEVIISEKSATFGMMIPRSSLRFVPYLEDIDIIHALLAWMAEPGNQLTRNRSTT